ncbi:MAG: TatD family hydrolase [Saprospiraceae bacterium]|nr:TatD family hydrolase [Saprospiraceae bacterium]
MEVISLHEGQQKEYEFYTIGCHPWWTEKILAENQLELIKSKFLNDPFCLGIGECGLDSLKGPNLDLQELIFIQHIQLANLLGAPVIIHCVRAFDRLIKLRKKMGETPWVVHGFLRNKILAAQLIEAGCYLSLAPTKLMTNTFRDTLLYLPLDRVFIETDGDSSTSILERYRIFCELRNLKLVDLSAQIFMNFKNFYKEKWKYHHGWKEPNS